MKLELVLAPNPILQRPTRPLKSIKPKHRELAHVMLFYMYMWKGVGLSANQVGREISLFVANDGTQKLIAFNPEIKYLSDEIEILNEACLSSPGINLQKERHKKVILEYWDIDGNLKVEEFQGFMSQIIQHEMLHLSGTIFE